MKRSTLRRAAAVVLVAAAAACGDSSGPVNSVTRFISRVTALDTSIVATLVTGTPPGSAMGPAAIVTAPPTVINGGSGQVRIVAADSFGTVIVFVFGYPDYYALTLPVGDTLAEVLVTIAPDLNAANFNWRFAVGDDAQSLGPYTDAPVTVVQVGTGDVQVSVSWDVDSDVDLHLVEPGGMGEEIYYGNAVAASGGELDLDSNAGCNIDQVRNENITYPGAPPSGTYTVRVDYWDSCSVSQTNYVVTVRVKGQATKVFTGSFTGTGDNGGAGSGTTITTFTY
jgi:hypothetical protein